MYYFYKKKTKPVKTSPQCVDESGCTRALSAYNYEVLITVFTNIRRYADRANSSCNIENRKGAHVYVYINFWP